MLNSNNQRELAYVVKIDGVVHHPNADRLDICTVNGWSVITGREEFKAGDLAIYFEIDSKLPEKEPWTSIDFLASKHFKIKTQKIRGELSQGFLASMSILEDATKYKEGDFLTSVLEVTYSVVEDNRRKSSSGNKYSSMASRHIKLAKTPIWRWLWRRKWGKELLFFFFGRKKDKRSDWPAWVVKTDEERIENEPWILQELIPGGEKPLWIATEKIDGTSTTFTARKNKFGKIDFYVCSRNVVFDTPAKADRCYYDQNYYLQMAERYNVKDFLVKYLKENKDIDWVTIQGETFGEGIQKRGYVKEPEMRVFNFIDSVNGRWNSIDGKEYVELSSDMEWVPILETMTLPYTIGELREYVHNTPSKIDGEMREGVVFRSIDGKRSFKCVDPEYLIKYHC